jgi:hypothetical protein
MLHQGKATDGCGPELETGCSRSSTVYYVLNPCQSTVVFRSIRMAIWGVTTLTNRTFRMTPWDMCDLRNFFVFTPCFDPNLGKFRVTSKGPFV